MTRGESMRRLRAKRKGQGMVEFRAWCENKIRYDYMMNALTEPLCQGCGREEAECSADPCEDVIIDRGGLANTMLVEPTFTLIRMGVKETGTYDPVQCLERHGEQFFLSQYREAESFLAWVVDTGKTFGRKNIEEVYSQFRRDRYSE